MQRPNFTFKRLRRDDLPSMLRWHNEPHVKRWYDRDKDMSSPAAIDDEYRPILDGTDPTEAFVIVVDDTPIGYIQTYRIADNPAYAEALGLGDDRSAGVDMFIGDPGYVHRGLGAAILARFLADVVFIDPGIDSCVIGPEPDNAVAIRAYEKAGFRYLKTVRVPGEDEGEYILRIGRPDLPAAQSS